MLVVAPLASTPVASGPLSDTSAAAVTLPRLTGAAIGDVSPTGIAASTLPVLAGDGYAAIQHLIDLTLPSLTGEAVGLFGQAGYARLPALTGAASAYIGHSVMLSDAAAMGDALGADVVLLLASHMFGTDALSLPAHVTIASSDTAAIADSVFSIYGVDLPTTVSATDDLDGAVAAVLELAILLETQDTQTTSLSIATNLLETLIAQDVIHQLADLDLNETLAMADQLSNAIQAHLALPETTQLLAELETAIVIPCTEPVTLVDTGTISVAALLSLTDGAAFIARLPLEDGDYQAWVMNAETTGTTQYVNYPMNSVFTFQGVPYGVSETGLYRLEGADDDGEPINAVIATGDMNFGTSREKNIPRAYLYLTQTGQVVLKTISSRQGSRHETYYELAERTTDSTDDDTYRRVPLGRGVRGVWWRFEIHALDGATINLDGAEIRPVVLSRRG